MLYVRSVYLQTSSLSSLLSLQLFNTVQALNALFMIYLLSFSSRPLVLSLSDYLFLFIVTILALICYSYLYKSSKYIYSDVNNYTDSITKNSINTLNQRINTLNQRNVLDKLVVTSFSYALVGILAVYYNEPIFAIMLVFTSICSATYHYHYEGIYFNADNILATSVAVIFIRTLILSFMYYDDNEILCITGTVGLFIAAFLLVYCGMPAVITELNGCSVRNINPAYALIHSVWHLISGFGPLFSILTLQNLKQNDIISKSSILGSDYYILDFFPFWPTVSILIGILVNGLGNSMGIMPVN